MTSKTWLVWVGVAMSAAAILPVIWLGYSAFPTIDDFPCSLSARDHGLLTSIMGWYHSWTARYFAAFLWGICPLVYNWQEGYQLTPLFIVLFHLLCGYGFFALLNPVLPVRPALRWVLSLTWVGLYISAAPSLPQSFYYYNGAVCYQPACALTLLALAGFVRLWHMDIKSCIQNPVPFVVLCGSIVLIVGSNEASMLAISLLSAAFWLSHIGFKKKLSWAYTLSTLVNLVWVAVVIFSPATRNRMNLSGSHKRSLDFIATSGIRYIGEQVADWFTNPWFLTLSFLLVALMVAYQIRISDKHFWLLIITGIGIYFLMHIPSFLGEGMVQGRTANTFYFVWMLVWILVLNRYFERLWPLVLVAGLAFFLWPSARKYNLSVIYSDIFSGTAAAHQAEFKVRMQLIEASPADTVYVPRYRHLPGSSYLSDIREYEGGDYYDQFYARMYGKKWIDFIDNKPVKK